MQNITQVFVPELDAVVMSDFTFNGEKFTKADPPTPFDHRSMNVDRGTLSGLWLAGYIRFVSGPGKVAVKTGEIDDLRSKVAVGLTLIGDGAQESWDALERLVEVARGNSTIAATVKLGEDPADEPDPAFLKAQIAAMRDKLKEAEKAAKLKGATKPTGLDVAAASTDTIVTPEPTADHAPVVNAPTA